VAVECGDIFESSEFKDMMIEDTRLKKGVSEEISIRAECAPRVSASDHNKPVTDGNPRRKAYFLVWSI